MVEALYSGFKIGLAIGGAIGGAAICVIAYGLLARITLAILASTDNEEE